MAHHTMPHHTTPRHTTPHHTTPHHTTPHHTTPRHATSGHIPHHATSHHTTSHHTTLHATPHHTTSHGRTGHGTHPASCTMSTGSFLGVKSGRGVRLTSHPLLVPGQERIELYLYSPYGPYGLYRASLPVQGGTLPLPLPLFYLTNIESHFYRIAYLIDRAVSTKLPYSQRSGEVDYKTTVLQQLCRCSSHSRTDRSRAVYPARHINHTTTWTVYCAVRQPECMYSTVQYDTLLGEQRFMKLQPCVA